MLYHFEERAQPRLCWPDSGEEHPNPEQVGTRRFSESSSDELVVSNFKLGDPAMKLR
jgi:hypothetical protein